MEIFLSAYLFIKNSVYLSRTLEIKIHKETQIPVI